MADLKISQLTNASALAGADVAPFVQSGANVKATVQQIITAATGATGTNGETVTTSKPRFDLTQTWNNGSTTFTGLKFNATDTASAAGSLLADLQVGGTSKFTVDKSGTARATNAFAIGPGFESFWNGSGIGIAQGGYYTWDGGAADLRLYRDAANALAQRNSTNAQTYRLYNTYTDASNYERVSLGWSGNTCTLKAENAGTGSARKLTVEAGSYQLASTAVTTDTGTSRTLSAADNGTVIYFTSSSAITVNTATGLGAGFSCVLIQGGTGQITVAQGSSTTRVGYLSLYKSAGQYAALNIVSPVADTFIVSGQSA